MSDRGTQVRLRRGPRVGAFLVLGLVLGALVGLIAGMSAPPTSAYPRGQVVGFLVLLFAPVGVVLAGLIAVVLDAASRRRARVVHAERETAAPDPVTEPPAAPEPAAAAVDPTVGQAPRAVPEDDEPSEDPLAR